jgi:hypothetical protein
MTMPTTIITPNATSLPLIQPPGSAAAVTRYLRTQWPRVGGYRLLPLPADAFTNTHFLNAYKPGYISYPYLAACGRSFDRPDIQSGLFGVACRLQLPVYKLSATESADPRRRLKCLNADRYASLVRDGESYREESGFDGWAFQLFLPNRSPLPGSPVSWDGRFFSVRLPDTLHTRVFEKLLHARMQNASFNTFLMTPAGRNHCATLGLDPAQQQRFTHYRFCRTPRIGPAEELYIFRPDGEDSDRLLIILERIVHDWCLGRIKPPASWRDRSQYSRQASATDAS